MKATGNDIKDDSQSDYQSVKQSAAAMMRRGVWQNRFKERFVPLSERELRSDLPPNVFHCLAEGKHHISYSGMPMAKDPFDIVLYEILFFELQPKTILELGAYTGASAVWMADTMKSLDLECQIHSVEYDMSLLDEKASERADVNFIEGDCNHIEQALPIDMLKSLPHPVVVIDDVHVNIAGVYEYLRQHLLKDGDYLIVEDTVPHIPATFGVSAEEASSDVPYDGEHSEEWGDWKWREIEAYFEQHPGQFLVDRYYTDFFGYNGTWNWNGFIRYAD